MFCRLPQTFVTRARTKLIRSSKFNYDFRWTRRVHTTHKYPEWTHTQSDLRWATLISHRTFRRWCVRARAAPNLWNINFLCSFSLFRLLLLLFLLPVPEPGPEHMNLFFFFWGCSFVRSSVHFGQTKCDKKLKHVCQLWLLISARRH